MRYGHASTIITSDGHTVMTVIGGHPAYDSCIYNDDTSTWEQVIKLITIIILVLYYTCSLYYHSQYLIDIGILYQYSQYHLTVYY